MEVDVERRRETTRREGRKGCAVITAQLSRLNNVERPTRRNSRRMSYRFRYFLVEEPKKGRGGIRNRERERERERERAREGRIRRIDHAIIGNATITAGAPINRDASARITEFRRVWEQLSNNQAQVALSYAVKSCG